MNIYFVCTGNTCRSPMAEAILKNKDLKGIEVRSAGVYASEGIPMSENAMTILDRENIKHNHSASLFNQGDAEWADLILTMTSTHKEHVLRLVGDAHEKVFTLNEYALPGSNPDILDPYGGNLAMYQRTFEQLNKVITELENKLKTED